MIRGHSLTVATFAQRVVTFLQQDSIVYVHVTMNQESCLVNAESLADQIGKNARAASYNETRMCFQQAMANLLLGSLETHSDLKR